MSRPAPAPAIVVSIGELRLTGFDPHGRNDLGDRVAVELRQLMTASGVRGAGDLSIDQLDVGRVTPGATREETARRIAQRIHAQIEARMGDAPRGGD
jgi:hypothetical protein